MCVGTHVGVVLLESDGIASDLTLALYGRGASLFDVFSGS